MERIVPTGEPGVNMDLPHRSHDVP